MFKAKHKNGLKATIKHIAFLAQLQLKEFRECDLYWSIYEKSDKVMEDQSLLTKRQISLISNGVVNELANWMRRQMKKDGKDYVLLCDQKEIFSTLTERLLKQNR